MNSINRVEIADGVFFSSVKDSRFMTMKITSSFRGNGFGKCFAFWSAFTFLQGLS